MAETVRYQLVDHVATITYNRPERLNAINGEMRADLNATWERFRDDNEAWVAIVTGEGRAFCAGADLKDGAGSTGDFPATFWEIPTINSFESGLELFKPTIAAVNGPCIGYGLTGALACDFIIASDRASFSYPEVRLGNRRSWAPSATGACLGDAMESAPANGDAAGPRRCDWCGRSSRTTIARLANDLATRLCQSAPLAVRATKEVAQRTRSMPWIEAVRFGETMRKVANQTDDAAEARRAASDNRPPVWRGQ